jgi:hypothetical protein
MKVLPETIKCPICDQEFLTGQGRAGHMRWVHHIKGAPVPNVPRLVTVSEVETMLAAVEEVQAGLLKSIEKIHEVDLDQDKKLTKLASEITELWAAVAQGK